MVEQATRTLFPNYFNGSEIVIAGKLADSKAGQLHVEVTASNSKKFVILKTDVPVEPQRVGGGAGDPNHVERLWSYLTVKELLSSWRHSRDAQEKERLRQQAQALALAYRFLTPLTALNLRRSAAPAETPEAVVGPETVMQSLRGAPPQPGEQGWVSPRQPQPVSPEGGRHCCVCGAARVRALKKVGSGAFLPEMSWGKSVYG